MTTRRWIALALAVVALLLAAGRIGGALYVDHAWYDAMGAGALWRAKVVYTLLLRGVTALLGTAFVFANLFSVRHSIVSLVLPRRVGDLEIGEEVPGRTLMAGVLVLSAALGALLTIPYGDWTLLAQAWRGLAYGEYDPYHQVDIGFWVHWLPLETALYHWALLVLLVVSIVVVALYALTPSLRWDRGTLRVTTYVRRHLVVLGAVALVVLGWSYRLDQYRLLIAGSGPADQFTWGDHQVRMTGNAVLGTLSVVMAVVVLLTGWMGQMRRAFVGVTVVLVLSVLLRQALPELLERTTAPRGYAEREGPYLRTRDMYSRRAVGLEQLSTPDTIGAPPVVAPLPGSRGIGGVSVWDARALGVALERVHRGTAVAGDAGWRASERGIEAVIVTRPATTSGEPATSWSVARIDADVAVDGAPDATERPITPPLVWPGAYGWAIVDDPGGRVPAARLSSTLSRLAHAWGEQNLRFFDAELGAPGTRLVLRRDVRERVGALAPFFAQGEQVTPVLAGGSLHWVVRLYAASDWYPLSTPVVVGGLEWRSWRQAATALVDAGTGRVRLVAAPQRDTLGESWVRMFPTLFTPADSLAPELAAQLPPDAEGAVVQATVLGAAGLAAREAPVRRALADAGGDSLVAREPTPFLVGGAPAVAVPLLDEAGALAGAVVVRGGARPGATWRPAAGPALGWDAARDRLQRGADSAAAGRDGRLLPGAMRLVPLAGNGWGLVLSQYRWRGDVAPELLRTAALVGDTVRAGRTSAVAFGVRDSVATGAPLGVPVRADSARASVLYDRMREALRRGDWRAFGEAFDALGAALGRPPR